MSFIKTRAVCNPIGVRKAPRPKGRTGFVRIDPVHQGDLDGLKGVYHITCVDKVSQGQVQACVQGISQAADAQTDLAAAQKMQRAKTELVELFNRPQPGPAQRA